MAGTTIRSLELTKVVDGDTVKVMLDGREESLRLACLDTEESWPGGNKPVTAAGRQASRWAKQWFGVGEEGFPEGDVRVDIDGIADEIPGRWLFLNDGCAQPASPP